MSEEAMNELINNFEYVERLTLYGRKHIKEYVQKLEKENKELHNKIYNAIEELDRIITFCENDSQGGYNVCNMAIRNYKNIRSLLKGGSGIDD